MQRAALGDPPQRVLRPPVGDDHVGARRRSRSCPPRSWCACRRATVRRRRRRPSPRWRRDALDDRNVPRVRIERRRRGVEAVDVGEQHEEVGADHGRDAGGEAVVVAVADLARRDGVVLVDDRHGAHVEELQGRRAGVEVAAALLGIGEGHEDLARGDGRDAPAPPTRSAPARSARPRPPPGSPRASAAPAGSPRTVRPSAMAPDETTSTSTPRA